MNMSFYCEGCQQEHQVSSLWQFNGDHNRPTLSPSIMVKGVLPVTDKEAERIMKGERFQPKEFSCHSFIKDGQIEYLDDCTHHLAGQTIKLKHFNFLE